MRLSLFIYFTAILGLTPFLQAEMTSSARLVVPPGNLAITPSGRKIISLHPFFEPKSRVMEITKSGTLEPFPNEILQQPGTPLSLDSVLGICADRNSVVWMLDSGTRSQITPKIVAWDTNNNKLHRVIYIPAPATVASSFLNDLVVDLDHQAIYITDTAQSEEVALIVVDLKTGVSRRVLQGDKSVVFEDVELLIDGDIASPIGPDGNPVKFRIGANPIASDPAREWLYFGPMHGGTLYRVRTKDLRDTTIPAEELAKRVETFGEKPICDGMVISSSGKIYITDIAGKGFGTIGSDGKYKLLESNEDILWPNALCFGTDGFLYMVDARLQHSPRWNAGETLIDAPFQIFKWKPAAGKKK